MDARLSILDTWVDPVDRRSAIRFVEDILISGERPHSIFASNPEKNFQLTANPILYDAIKTADLLIPDGIGVVFAARFLYGVRIERVPGSEFIFDICALAERRQCGVYIYGATEAVNRAAAQGLKRRFPNLQIAGRSHGYVPEPEMPDLVDRINQSRARVLFLALGSPRQESWYLRHKDQLKYVRVCQGIGGTLDTIAGTVKRAPEIWCRYNVEWLYRLLKEPRRIKRQVVIPIFALKVFVQKLTRAG